MENKFSVQTVELSKVYSMHDIEVSALSGVNLNIQYGEFLAIVGPSGSGKSTLLNVLGTLDRPSSGKVIIDGVDTSVMSKDELAKLRNEKIGFVFQSFNLINRTSVLRNVELPSIVKGIPEAERKERAKELLSSVGLEAKASRKPTMLSGGEQQRVAIARALINAPPIILADEPTGNLDSKTGHEIFEFLKRLSVEHKTTVMIVTHNLELAKQTNRIIRLRDGHIEDSDAGGEPS